MLIDETSDLNEFGQEIGDLRKRPHALVHSAGLLHSRGVLEKIASGVAAQTFSRADAAKCEIHVRAAGCAAQHFVAERDGIAEQICRRVVLDGALVVRHGIGDAPLTHGEITDLVEQGDIDVPALGLALRNCPRVGDNRAIELLELLELCRFFPEICGDGHSVEADSGD